VLRPTIQVPLVDLNFLNTLVISHDLSPKGIYN
jgi:hypothetical protein